MFETIIGVVLTMLKHFVHKRDLSAMENNCF